MCRKNGSFIPWLAIIVGALVLLGLVLPRWLWVLLCGLSLVCGGICLLLKR